MSSAAPAERAFVERFRAQFGADAALLTGADGLQGGRPGGESAGAAYHRDAAANEAEIDRLLPRLGGNNRRKRRPAAASSAALTAAGLERPPDVLHRFLGALFRRFAGRLLVQGRLLNLEELLVTHFMRVDPSGSAPQLGKCDQGPCVCIREGSVRFVVRCVGATAAQIGRDAVLARLVAPHEADVLLDADEDASERHSERFDDARPVAVVASSTECDAPWSSQQALEHMPAVYGFDIDAFATSEGSVDREYEDDDDDAKPLNALLISSRLFRDLRGTDKLMEMFQMPSDKFQSFVWTATSAHRRQPSDRAIVTADASAASSSPNPWSYKELDSAQKRKWADERYEYGLELQGKRKTPEAMAEFESALSLNDRHVGALVAKGRAHMAARQLQDAVDCLERAVEIDPLLATAQDDLLRAKSMLAHSRHVSSDSGYDELGRARAGTDRAATRSRDRPYTERRADQDTGRERPRNKNSRAAASSAGAKSLEEERLRVLLEEEERRRKRSRQSRRRSRSYTSESDSSGSDRSRSRERRRSSSKKRKREKKHKKEKRKHKKSGRKRRIKKDSGRHDSDSSGSASSRAIDENRRSHRRRSPRGDSRSRADEEDAPGDLPAILSRTKHRIWN